MCKIHESKRRGDAGRCVEGRMLFCFLYAVSGNGDVCGAVCRLLYDWCCGVLLLAHIVVLLFCWGMSLEEQDYTKEKTNTVEF